MPKLKTHKSAQRRFKMTGTGKLMRYHVGKSHLRAHKTRQVRATYDRAVVLAKVDEARLQRSLPYGVK
jgi:large subunit ribosomal protein L35